MTEQEINVAIAGACGWKLSVPHFTHDYVWLRTAFKGEPYIDEETSAWAGEPHDVTDDWTGIPNYCADLNAMHEAEKALDYGQAVTYLKTLDEIVRRDPMGGIWSHFVHATARQRAEAFLRTISKWRD
jgi:hypothetical protein